MPEGILTTYFQGNNIGTLEVRLLRPYMVEKYRKKLVLYENQRCFLLAARLKAKLNTLLLPGQLRIHTVLPSLAHLCQNLSNQEAVLESCGGVRLDDYRL